MSKLNFVILSKQRRTNNPVAFDLPGRTLLCASLVTLLAACGGSGAGFSPAAQSAASANVGDGGATELYVEPGDAVTATSAWIPSAASASLFDVDASGIKVARPAPVSTSDFHLYVATTGSDSNTGTESEPFRTITRASRAARPDTTIHVASGTYRENV
ncbi:MAG: hypothetical protein JWR56_2946, partial [Massilia sp.]|nr:hypothetical protein [Massilia sp.]